MLPLIYSLGAECGIVCAASCLPAFPCSQARLREKSLTITDPALVAFLEFCQVSHNFEKREGAERCVESCVLPSLAHVALGSFLDNLPGTLPGVGVKAGWGG